MKYEKCVTCLHLGVDCDGPNFIAMEGKGLMEWCKRRKNYLGLSNKELAESSNVPIGTVDRLFAGNYENFRYSTVRPILQVLVGNEWGEHPCVDYSSSIDCLSQEIEKLEAIMKNHEAVTAQRVQGGIKLWHLVIAQAATTVALVAILVLHLV